MDWIPTVDPAAVNTTANTTSEYENIIRPFGRNRVPTIDVTMPLAALWDDIENLPLVEEERCCIYFLIGGHAAEEILYVGQSNNPHRRVEEHRKAGKIPFEYARLAVMDNEQQMNAVEAILIQKLKPKYNTKLRD